MSRDGVSSGKRTAQRKKVAAWCCRYWSLERDAAWLGKALDSREWIVGRSVGMTFRKKRLGVVVLLLVGEILMVWVFVGLLGCVWIVVGWAVCWFDDG